MMRPARVALAVVAVLTNAYITATETLHAARRYGATR